MSDEDIQALVRHSLDQQNRIAELRSDLRVMTFAAFLFAAIAIGLIVSGYL